MKKFINYLFKKIAGLFGYSVPSFENNPKAEKAAVAAAYDWLNLVDNQNYEESWKESAAQFQKNVPKNKWIEKSSNVREPMGGLVDREIDSSKYTTSLPGVPDGEYVIMKFKTQFENKKLAIETITFIKNDSWGATGYYIK